MDVKAAGGAFAGIALTIAGAATALFLTVGQAEPAPAPQTTEIVTEYVDQYGNPVDLTTPTATAEDLESAAAYKEEVEQPAHLEEYEEEAYEDHTEYDEEDQHEEYEEDDDD